MSILKCMILTDELQRLTDTLVHREKLLEEMQQAEDKMSESVLKLRFIGANGSLGLTHGKVYDVNVGYNSSTEDFYVEWNDVFGLGKIRCPYYSMQRLLENWEIPGEDLNMKNRSAEDIYADAIKAMGNYLGDKSKPEPTPAKPQNLDIQAIIDDAMKNKDRYVSILVTNEGHMSINVYPDDEEELCWIRDEETEKFICPSCGRPSIYQTIYCPHCGEKVKKNT